MQQHKIARLQLAYSLPRFETLIRLYFLRHSFEAYQSQMVHFLAFLASSAMGALRSATPGEGTTSSTILLADTDMIDAQRSTLLLCLKGLQDQGKNIYAGNLVLRIFQDRLNAEERKLAEVRICLRAEDEATSLRRSQTTEDIQAQWWCRWGILAMTPIETD